MDTIHAVSSGRPPAAIAVIRISGERAIAAAASLTGGRVPEPRHAALRVLRDEHGGILDQALVLVFPGPATATGEDLVELHCHGGRAVIAAVQRALAAIDGLRLAEPGEFTRRALMHDRIDLAQAEGLADLLAAETEDARRAAIASVEGHLSAEVKRWFARTAQIAASIESQIDFSDEDDVIDVGVDTIRANLQALAGDISAALVRPSVERLRDGVRVILAGPRNAGKSSLFNALVGRDAAIVSPIAGTTRDRVEAAVQRTGRAYSLIDTAGLADDVSDPIEAIGVERAREAMATADLVLWFGDTARDDDSLWIWSRADERGPAPNGAIPASVFWHGSIEDVWNEIDASVVRDTIDRPIYNQRQRLLIEHAAAALRGSIEENDMLLTAEHVRAAGSSLASVLGVNSTEAMLDALFGQFCIGK